MFTQSAGGGTSGISITQDVTNSAAYGRIKFELDGTGYFSIDQFEISYTRYGVSRSIGAISGQSIQNAAFSQANVDENFIYDMPLSSANVNGSLTTVPRVLDRVHKSFSYPLRPTFNDFDPFAENTTLLGKSVLLSRSRQLNGSPDIINLAITELVSGDTFETVEIGTQTWSAENLAITDGLTLGVDYFYPDNDVNNVADYGLLYTKAAATAIAATIDGWRLPTDAEVGVLAQYNGAAYDEGYNYKDIPTLDYWVGELTVNTNLYEFNYRGTGGYYNGVYTKFKEDGLFWISDQPTGYDRCWGLQALSDDWILFNNTSSQVWGHQIRLIKD